eukprot:gene2325-4525_t
MYTNDGSINHEQHDEFDFVIRKRYLSGHSLLGLWALIGSILCLLPLFSMWIFYDESDGQRTAPIYSSMTSPEFTHTVVACTAISVPMIMDFILNTMSLSDNTLFTRGSTVRAVLLLALFIPNMCIMFSAIRLRSPLILVCMFGVRGIVLIYAIGGHLWEFGAPIFQCNLFLFTLFIHMVSYIIRCYSVFSEDLGEILFYSYIGLSCLGLVMFLSLGYKWLKLLFSQPITELTVSQYSCNVVLISASIPLCMFILMSIITGGTIDRNTSVAYLTIYTYIETAFVVSIALLQSRLVTQEILKAEKSELLRLNASAESLDTLADLQSSVDIAVNTLNELLDYEKLDAGLMQIEPEITKSGPLILDIIRPFKPQAESYGVNFISDVGWDAMLVELEDIEVVDTGEGISAETNGHKTAQSTVISRTIPDMPSFSCKSQTSPNRIHVMDFRDEDSIPEIYNADIQNIIIPLDAVRSKSERLYLEGRSRVHKESHLERNIHMSRSESDRKLLINSEENHSELFSDAIITKFRNNLWLAAIRQEHCSSKIFDEKMPRRIYKLGVLFLALLFVGLIILVCICHKMPSLVLILVLCGEICTSTGVSAAGGLYVASPYSALKSAETDRSSLAPNYNPSAGLVPHTPLSSPPQPKISRSKFSRDKISNVIDTSLNREHVTQEICRKIKSPCILNQTSNRKSKTSPPNKLLPNGLRTSQFRLQQSQPTKQHCQIDFRISTSEHSPQLNFKPHQPENWGELTPNGQEMQPQQKKCHILFHIYHLKESISTLQKHYSSQQTLTNLSQWKSTKHHA